MNWTQEGIANLAGVLLAGGIGAVVKDTVSWFLKRKTDETPVAQRTAEQSIVEQALSNVKASNEQLIADVTRARERRDEIDKHAQEREEWWQKRWDEREKYWVAREAEYVAELDAMRERVVQLLDEMEMLRRKALARGPASD